MCESERSALTEGWTTRQGVGSSGKCREACRAVVRRAGMPGNGQGPRTASEVDCTRHLRPGSWGESWAGVSGRQSGREG